MSQNYTEAQEKLISSLDDTAEHVHWEFDESEYEGASTLGFANIGKISGRKSFVRSVKSSADNSNIPYVTEKNSGYTIEVGGLHLLLQKDSSGYRLSVSNVRDFIPDKRHQRLDVQERIHRLVLQRLQKHGYLLDSKVRTRMD